MRYRIRMMWIAATLAGLSLAAGPEDWADRADVEVARLEPPAEGSPNDPGALAVAAYTARPSDSRRAAAGRVIRRMVESSLASADDCDGQMTPRIRAASLLAQINDDDGARDLLEQARRVPPDYGTPAVSPEECSPYETAFILQATGDAEHLPELRLKSGWMLETFFEIAEDDGRTELADRLRRLISASPIPDPDYENACWSGALADDGFFPEAMAVAEGIGKTDSRLVYEQSVASVAVGRGDLQYLRRYRDNFVELARADRTLRSSTANVCEFVSQNGDREGVDKVAPLADFSRGKPEAVVDHAMLAAAFFRVGEVDQYRREIKSAADTLAAVPDDVSGNLAMAAAYARAGDKASVKKRLARIAKKLGRNDENVFDEELLHFELRPIVEAYLEADLVAEAMSVADRQPDPMRKLAAGLAAHRLAKDGKFAEARKLAMLLNAPKRLGIYCFVAREQVRQKSMTGLAEWIDALPSAYDRGTLDVAVENAVSGRRDRTFERATDERDMPIVYDDDDQPDALK